MPVYLYLDHQGVVHGTSSTIIEEENACRQEDAQGRFHHFDLAYGSVGIHNNRITEYAAS